MAGRGGAWRGVAGRGEAWRGRAWRGVAVQCGARRGGAGRGGPCRAGGGEGRGNKRTWALAQLTPILKCQKLWVNVVQLGQYFVFEYKMSNKIFPILNACLSEASMDSVSFVTFFTFCLAGVSQGLIGVGFV